MKGKKTGGRTKGTPNKTTATVKEAIEFAASGLGGGQRLMAWAQEDPANERIFWGQIYTKLLPLQVTGENGKDLIPPAITFAITQAPNSENQT
jgi:hypothetical protein